MTREEIQFLPTDAWLLLAIIRAAGNEQASLAEIIAIGDSIEHAIFTEDEMEGGLYRLTAGGYVEEVNDGFKPTKSTVQKHSEISKKKKAVQDQMEMWREVIGAPPWQGGTSIQSADKQKYEGFTHEKFAEAVTYYQENVASIFKQIGKKSKTLHLIRTKQWLQH